MHLDHLIKYKNLSCTGVHVTITNLYFLRLPKTSSIIRPFLNGKLYSILVLSNGFSLRTRTWTLILESWTNDIGLVISYYISLLLYCLSKFKCGRYPSMQSYLWEGGEIQAEDSFFPNFNPYMLTKWIVVFCGLIKEQAWHS